MARRSAIGVSPSNTPVPVYAQYATSDWLNPLLNRPEVMPFTLLTEPRDDWATATRPGTPQLPPSSQGREPGGLDTALAITPPSG